MLDKSIPYAGFYMRKNPGSSAPVYPLPDGFRYTFYKEGDEMSWARIEASVLEFDSEFAALLYFTERFIPYTDELIKRCLFIENETGDKVATATAWWSDIKETHRPFLQWVAVEPGYQGLGLGKAVISGALDILHKLEPDVPIYLHTQTWSYKAVGIYRMYGFEPTDEKALYRERKDNLKRAMRILKTKLH